MAEELLQEQRGSVLWLIINREERRNSINEAVVTGIGQALEVARKDRQVRAVVITGVGDRAFCAGVDLRSPQPFVVDYSMPHVDLGNLFRQARNLTVPLIARINGACLGAGMGLMAMCDLAVARSDAIFGLPEVKLGLFPAQVLSVMQHLVPRRILTELCISGEPVTAAQALAYHLVNYVDQDLDARLAWLMERLLDKSPSAVRRGLYMMKAIESMPFSESITFSESQIGLLRLTEDAAEGRSAFREKRKPRWTGR
jgi:enoyl-CoA hydratase/carnithine racemase